MATKEKWVDLFEKVIGRKPTASEFQAGKQSNFDPKKIKEIAGEAEEATTDTSLVENTTDEASDNQDIVQETPSEDSVTEESVQPFSQDEKQSSFESSQYEELRKNWLQAFENNIGRKPTKEEFAEAKSQGFSNLPIRSELLDSQLPQKPVKKAKKRISKKQAIMIGTPTVLVAALIGAFFYLNSITGVKVVTDHFAKAVSSKDFDEVASLLSTQSDKWTRAEARALVEHLESQEINLETELDNIVESNGKSAYIDDNNNKILGVTEKSKKFGIFQEYQMVSYPVKVKVNTNLDNATIKPGEKKTITLKKNTDTELGEYHFIKQDFTLKGKTDVGDVESKVQLDLATAKDNEIKLDLKSEKKQLKITMPSETSKATDIKIVVNGKESGSSLTPELQLVPYQELEIYAKFTISDTTFTTNKETVIVEDDTTNVKLSLPKEVVSKIREKNEEAKKVEAQKAKVSTFLNDYRSAVFSSVSNRSNNYSQYYDTSSAVYREMVEWTTGGGVKKAKINYYEPGALDIREIKEENGSYIVTTYEDYTVHYTDNTPNSVNRKNKTYYLKPSGDSFVIYNLEVSEG